MRTIQCPACKASTDYESDNCAKCGEPLAMAKLEEAMAGIRETTARFQHLEASASGRAFSTINGFGTMLLDYRPRGEGTWDAVRWVTAAGIPLVPLGGYVIRPLYQEHQYRSHTASFTVLERTPLSAQRVIRTYLLVAAALLPLVLGWMNASWLNRNLGGGKAFLLMLVAIGWAGYILFGRIKNDGKVYKPLPPRVAA